MDSRIHTKLMRPEIDGDAAIIAYGAEGLIRGELVAFPTETVYGLGANIFDENAVRSIFRVKGRPEDNPMIVHIASIDEIDALVMDIPDSFAKLADVFFPGPLTIVLKRSAAVLDVVTGGLDTVAIRMPAHDLALRLIRKAGVPVAAPSANLSGKASPVTAEQAFADLNGKVYAVLDGGPCIVGIESTVIDLTSDQPEILRPGMVAKEDIESVLGHTIMVASDADAQPRSPGMKYRHYAPDVLLQLIVDLQTADKAVSRQVLRAKDKGLRVALLAPERFAGIGEDVFYSFGGGTAVEYARLLYSGLRSVTPDDADVIICLGIEETGPGLAVMNRLRKSATEIVE